MSFPETGSSFFQVLNSGELACYLLWEKKLQQSMASGQTSYKYSKQSREIYVQREGRMHVIRSTSSFTGLFDEAYRKEIQDYIRQQKIRFKNASEEQLLELVDFCKGLIHGG